MSGVRGRVLHMTEQMKRKDGRELVTEFPVTAMDEIEYLPKGELPGGGFGCMAGIEPYPDEDWMYEGA